MNNTLCIYHGNCADGFGAAWVVRAAMGEGNVDFVPGVYQQPPPDVTGRVVVMVDFSYKRNVLLEMAAKAKSIVILDHHKTAQEDLVDLPSNVHAEFNMNRAGCMMAWNNYFPDQKPPQLLLHLEDRDLWKFQLPATREIQAAVFSYPYDFREWDMLMAGEKIPELIVAGAAIERKHFKDIRELLKVCSYFREIGGHNIPVASLPYTLTSDAGHIMIEDNPGVAFAACYWDTPDGRVFSLRSKGDFDVSAVAAKYGGGGHKNAAGFAVPANHPLAAR